MKTKEMPMIVIFAFLVGTFTGSIVFAFKYISSFIIKFSNFCYSFFRENLAFLPVGVAIVAALSLLGFFVARWEPNAKGGGITTALSAIRGYISLKWFRNLLTVIFSANVSYLAGLPLGNEGPSVQIGTNVGKAVTHISGDKLHEKQFMSMGAVTGFASAAGAPVSALFFAFEEVKCVFSIFNVFLAFISILSSTAVNFLLSKICNISPFLFDFKIADMLPIKYIFIAFLIGFICGIFGFAATKLHTMILVFFEVKLKKINLKVKFLILFVITAVTGVFLPEILGSGHSLIELLLEKNLALYLLFLVLILRMLFLMFLNSAGVTGGLFLPYLTFGALIGSIVSNILLKFGIVEQTVIPIIIIISMTAFLASVLKTPLTAICFSFEALGGIYNFLPIAVAVSVSFLTVKLFKLETFTETVVERKAMKNGLSK